MVSAEEVNRLRTANKASIVVDKARLVIHLIEFNPETGIKLPDKEIPINLADYRQERELLTAQLRELNTFITYCENL